ncbi:NAD(P)/FAD-dependent oxidoreductase [Desulfocurvus sp.]|uniref:NAD(P)/FAD-dependent oxidoreductase n=1 Tax=Desulfocurvus sp. TaxID=2871698 RepID=UPI0025C1C266|nr:NAD(P)/FAD-dependent oxidoreductase [Desulfocurvus sp.]MCK9241032.1 NAD(P)/FAD-dependent oxidoreductase [Desulfocurvus sp.]
MHQVQLLIVGQGPAGLSAAIYAARADIETVVVGLPPKIDGEYDIDNYLGFPETTKASVIMAAGRAQAERFGAKIVTARVLGIHMNEAMRFEVKTESGHYDAGAVILATGVSKVRPGISNFDDYDGKGISYCVSCDGFFYRGRPVVALGEGVYAASQALELLAYTDKVALCTQGKEMTISPEYLKKLGEANIEIITRKIVELRGAPALDTLVFDDGSTYAADGLFIAMGEASSSDFAWTLGLERNGNHIVANAMQETNIPGVFAAGDCVGRFAQISVAVGEGAIAARQAIKYCRNKCPKPRS